MKKGVIFIAGIYGVGKSTVAEQLSKSLGLPCFHASELITAKNNEAYGATKHVSDVGGNQNILADAVAELKEKHDAFILTGHFAIFSRDNKVVEVPQEVFGKLGLSAIVLLETTVERAIQNIDKRDGKSYSAKDIEELQQAERRQAEQVFAQCNITLHIRQMDFSTDAVEVEKMMREETK